MKNNQSYEDEIYTGKSLKNGTYQIIGVIDGEVSILTREELEDLKVIFCDCHYKVVEKYKELVRKGFSKQLLYKILKLQYNNCFGLY